MKSWLPLSALALALAALMFTGNLPARRPEDAPDLVTEAALA